MQHADGESIVVVGDLHLAGGRDPNTGAMATHELFFHDDAFARFLDDVRIRASEQGRRSRLLILGDLFDFLRVDGKHAAVTGGRPDTSERATLAKMERVAAGHPAVFAALARFVSAGHALDIVPGNHDIELARASAQEQFKTLLIRCGCAPQSTAQIGFHPWIYFVPGVLYAEHGHQYHDINAFLTLMEPTRHRHPDEIDLPLGSSLDVYLLGLRATTHRVGGASHSSPPTLLGAFRAHPSLLVRTLPQHASFVLSVLRALAAIVGRGQAQRRAAYRDTVLRSHAARIGLSHDALVAIDELSARSTAAMRSRLLRRSVLALRTSLARRLWVGSPRSHPPVENYLQRPAVAIHGILDAADQGVPFYAFGHTHRAEQRPLVARHPPSYLNGGSWIVKEPAAPDATEQRPPFTFVVIERPPGTRAPVARVMRWDDAAGQATPLPDTAPPRTQGDRR